MISALIVCAFWAFWLMRFGLSFMCDVATFKTYRESGRTMALLGSGLIVAYTAWGLIDLVAWIYTKIP